MNQNINRLAVVAILGWSIIEGHEERKNESAELINAVAQLGT